MHEVSLCENIIRQLQESAQKENFRRVMRIWLEIGSLSHVTGEAMSFAFDAVAKETIAEGARLEIISRPAEGHCPECNKLTPMRQRFDACGHCGYCPLTVMAGEEMRIQNIEVM